MLIPAERGSRIPRRRACLTAFQGPWRKLQQVCREICFGLSLSSCEVKCGDEHVQSALLQGGVLMLTQTRMLTRRISSRSMGCPRSPWTPLPVMTPFTGASLSSRPSRCAHELSIDCIVPLAYTFQTATRPVSDVSTGADDRHCSWNTSPTEPAIPLSLAALLQVYVEQL